MAEEEGRGSGGFGGNAGVFLAGAAVWRARHDGRRASRAVLLRPGRCPKASGAAPIAKTAEEPGHGARPAGQDHHWSVVAGQLVDQLAHRARYRAPEQARTHGRHGRRRPGRRRRRPVPTRSNSGSRSVNSCRARADMAMPGRMAPPRKAPSADTQIDGDGRADVDDDGRPARRRRRLAATASSRRSTPTMSGRGKLDLQRQVAGGQQRRRGLAGGCSAASRSAAWRRGDSRCRCTSETAAAAPPAGRNSPQASAAKAAKSGVRSSSASVVPRLGQCRAGGAAV